VAFKIAEQGQRSQGISDGKSEKGGILDGARRSGGERCVEARRPGHAFAPLRRSAKPPNWAQSLA
jgi:hypothetical protein